MNELKTQVVLTVLRLILAAIMAIPTALYLIGGAPFEAVVLGYLMLISYWIVTTELESQRGL